MNEFVKGEFVRLEAKTTIHLGRLEMNLNPGDVIEYDGSTLRIGSQETSMPELKAGIKRGWLKSAGESAPSKPEPAPSVTPSKTEMPVESVYDEETPVGTINETASEPEIELSLEEKYPVQVSEVDEDTTHVATVEGNSGADINLTSSGGDSGQDAVALSTTIKTATQKKTVLSDSSSIESEIRSLENLEVQSFPVVVPEEESEQVASLDEEVTEEDSDVEESTEVEGELEQVLKAVESDAPEQGAIEVGEESKVKILPSGIEWDMSVFWSTRAKTAVELYGDNPTVLEEIKAVESAGVIKAIDKKLASN